MDPKKIGKALLYPPTAIKLALLPLATVLLVGSMSLLGVDTPIAYFSYVLSAYTLTVLCLDIPRLFQRIKRFKSENKYARRWREDARLRVNVTLYGSLLWNTLYGILQLWLGLYHHTFWFLSLGVYSVCLALMRFFLVRHTGRFAPGEQMKRELLSYRLCGWILLVMNLALALIVFFMVYWNRTFIHHMITAIAMAAYTFTAFTTAVINVVKYRKYNSPAFSASKAISFAAACVSMLTLTSTMMTTFGEGKMDPFTQKLMLGGVGAAVSATVLAIALYMIVRGTEKIRQYKKEEQNERQ